MIMEMVEAPQPIALAMFKALPLSIFKYSLSFMTIFSHVVTCVSMIIFKVITMNDYWRKRLKMLRENTGMNQGELSEKSGVARSQISMLENGTRAFTQKTIDAVLGALGCTYHDLFTVDNPVITPAQQPEDKQQDNVYVVESKSDSDAAIDAVYYIIKEGTAVEIERLRKSAEYIKYGIESKKKLGFQQSQVRDRMNRAA
jgi:transcriptional regulator with XRE-family HTH domain